MVFAVKANRFITHMRKLTQPQEPITRLFGSIEALKEKLGPILFQLPPKWKVNVTRLREFLEALPSSIGVLSNSETRPGIMRKYIYSCNNITVLSAFMN
jgi:uncharacterized protein YecE (DUF72 family)